MLGRIAVVLEVGLCRSLYACNLELSHCMGRFCSPAGRIVVLSTQASRSPSMSFEIGQTVVYPHHGAATIEEVMTRTIRGEERTYLKLRVNQGDLEIQVPAENVDMVGVRDIVDEDGPDEGPRNSHLRAGPGAQHRKVRRCRAPRRCPGRGAHRSRRRCRRRVKPARS